MRTVYTKEQLESAIKANESSIRIAGPMAEKYIRGRKVRKFAKGGALAGTVASVALLAAAPFTGGTTAVPAIFGLTASTTSAMTISAAELAIICGAVIAALAMKYGYKRIRVNSDGSVTIEKD